MKSNLQTIADIIKDNFEGGYSDNSDDNGNWTSGHKGIGNLAGSNMGISAPVLSTFYGHSVTAAEMKAVTEAQFISIFAANYWNSVDGDNLPSGIDMMIVDHAYNRSRYYAAAMLQQLVETKIDGWIGQETISAISYSSKEYIYGKISPIYIRKMLVSFDLPDNFTKQDILNTNSITNNILIIHALATMQVIDYKSLADEEFMAGWINRVNNRLDFAVSIYKGMNDAIS